MNDLDVIIKTIRSGSDVNSKAYKVTEYYIDLTSGMLDAGGIAIASCKLLNIEKELRKWMKDYPSSGGSAVMQPEESAIILIDDLREKELLK